MLCSRLRGYEVFVVEKSNVTQWDIIVLWTLWFPHKNRWNSWHPPPLQTTRGGYKVFQYGFKQETKARLLKEARKGLSLLQCLGNVGRLQRRISNGVGKLYVSLQLYCWAILWGYLWRHISYHGNAQGPQKRPLNFSFCKLSEKLIRWPTIFISLLESSLNCLTFQTVWKKFIQ